MVIPITGSAITEARKMMSQNTGGIGRKTTEIEVTNRGSITYETSFNVKLWEIAAAGGMAYLIWWIHSGGPGNLMPWSGSNGGISVPGFTPGPIALLNLLK